MNLVLKLLFGGLAVYLVFEFTRTYLLRPRRFNQLVKAPDGNILVLTQYPHGLSSGDKVAIKQDNPPPFGTSCRARVLVPKADGIQTIVSVPDAQSFIINVKWSNPCIDGYNAVWSGWYNLTK